MSNPVWDLRPDSDNIEFVYFLTWSLGSHLTVELAFIGNGLKSAIFSVNHHQGQSDTVVVNRVVSDYLGIYWLSEMLLQLELPRREDPRPGNMIWRADWLWWWLEVSNYLLCKYPVNRDTEIRISLASGHTSVCWPSLCQHFNVRQRSDIFRFLTFLGGPSLLHTTTNHSAEKSLVTKPTGQ